MNKKRKIIIIVAGIFLLASLLIGISYAYYMNNAIQDGSNAFGSACFKITFTDSNDISLMSSLPIKDKDADNLTPYTFTITNVCKLDMDYNINLETLSGTTMDLNAIKYKLNKSNPKVLGTISENSSSVFINDNVTSSKTIKTGLLKPNVSKTFELRMWIDYDSTYEQASQKDFFSKLVVSTIIYDDNVAMLKSGKDFNKIIRDLAGDEPSEEQINEITPEIENMREMIRNYEEGNGEVDESDFLDYEGDYNYYKRLIHFYDTFGIYALIVDSNVEQIIFTNTPPEDGIVTEIISTENSKSDILTWYDNGVIYIYSPEKKIYLNRDSSGMFLNLSSLTSLDVSNFDSTKVVDMSYMFNTEGMNINHSIGEKMSIKSITGLDNFDTFNVENMEMTFACLNNITNLEVEDFDTSNVVNMSYMFAGDNSIASLDLSKWNTSNVTNMSGMFGEMINLTYLNISGFDTSNVTDMSGMFGELEKIENLDLSNFDTMKVTNMTSMFSGMENLKTLNLNSFNTSEVTSMNSMFYRLEGMESLDVSNFNTSKVTDMGWMFSYMVNLASLDISGFDTSKVVSMECMFSNSRSLENLDLSSFDTTNVKNMSYMFSYMNSLTEINVSHFNTSNVINMASMFSGLGKVQNLDLSNFDTMKVTNMTSMFSGMESLKTLNVSSFNTSEVTSMNSMFYRLFDLESLDVSNFDTSKVTDMGYMFRWCSSLTNLDVSNFNTSNVTNMSEMFASLFDLESLNVSNFDTSNVTDMSNMFDGDRELLELDISSFDTSNVTNMYSMFFDDFSLKIIYVSDKWNTSKVTRSNFILSSCSKLTGGKGTKWSNSKNSINYAKIDCGSGAEGLFTLKGTTSEYAAYCSN